MALLRTARRSYQKRRARGQRRLAATPGPPSARRARRIKQRPKSTDDVGRLQRGSRMDAPRFAGARSEEGHRLTVTVRLLLILAGVAACSTAFALVVQERSLSRDLERAARARLDRAARAAERLVESHLASLGERYRAVSGTPQLRASLELDHAPTLAFQARELAQ